MKLASTVTLDMNKGVFIDGIKFPFYVADHAEVTAGRDLITTVTLDLYVDGPVTVRDREGKRRIYLDGDGEVAEWARRLVREGLLERIPDLELPTEGEDKVSALASQAREVGRCGTFRAGVGANTTDGISAAQNGAQRIEGEA